jgi:CheY-like chemotaxis protein
MACALPHILLVEDDPGHARLIMKNLQRAGVFNPIDWVDNGQLAVDRLLPPGDSAQECQPLPGLVLLDLNLPGLDGFQVLTRLRGAARTRELPVAVLTTTDQPGEIRRCYELGCNSFLRKPIVQEQFAETLAGILQLLGAVEATPVDPSGAASGPIRAGHT